MKRRTQIALRQSINRQNIGGQIALRQNTHEQITRSMTVAGLATSCVLSYVPAALSVVFAPSADEPAPRSSVESPSHGSLCPQTLASAERSRPVGLLPQNAYGKTLAAHPTLLFYLPESNADGAVFTLKDEDKTLLYFSEISLSGAESVVGLTLPDQAPALEVGQRYQWFIVFKCEGQLYPDSDYINGWIERTAETDLQQAIATSSELNKAESLGLSGIWYDSLAILATLRTEHPQSLEITAHWHELLDTVGLGEFAEVPIVLPN